MDKLRELERTRASLRSQPGGSGSAAGSSLLAQVGSSLLAQPCWIDEHALGVQQLRVSAPVISPGKQHATRSLSAVVTTPHGTKRPASTTVVYTLPPEGEPASASKLGCPQDPKENSFSTQKGTHEANLMLECSNRSEASSVGGPSD